MLETNVGFTALQVSVPTNETHRLDTSQLQVEKPGGEGEGGRTFMSCFSIEHFQHLCCTTSKSYLPQVCW